MVENIRSYLNIKPIEAYSGKGNGKTTITGFGQVLADQTISEKKQTSDTKSVQKKESDGENQSEKTVTYKEPVTGKKVIYKDVAKDEEKTDTKVSTSGTKSTTSAKSMKKTKYDSYFKAAAKKYGVSESLLKAIAKAESNFNAKDVSSAGAIGVMQLMPATAKGLGVKNPYDPKENIMGGAKCIAQKLKEFNGNVRMALAAYNAGSGAVKRYGGIPSYCKSYISKVLSYKEAYETAAAVG